MKKVVLISGCSSGFGLHTAVRAAAQGHRVWATMRDLSRGDALERAAAQAGVSLEVRALDVDDQVSIDGCVAEIERECGRVDVLVNNAGFALGGTVYDTGLDELRGQLETNFFGAVALAKAVLPGMVSRGSGRIVQVSSMSATSPMPGLGAYAASKRALEGITEAMRMELAPFGVQVTSVAPGTFRTEIFRKRRLARAFGSADSPFRSLSERALERLDRAVERHAGDPVLVAAKIVELMEVPDPPLRVVIGRNARLQAVVRRFVPQRAWENLMRRIAGMEA